MARSNSLQLKAYLLKKALIFSAFFYVSISANPGVLANPGILASTQINTLSHASTSACPPPHIDETARVNYVYDGDTVQLEDGRKIRLLGIDTPEIFSKRGSVAEAIKRSGEQAKAALQGLLNRANQHVGLAYGGQRFDRYQRSLAHVFLPDGTNLQAQLISQGHAIAFTTPPNDAMSDCYQQLETQAIKQVRGIWKLPQYQLKRVTQLKNTSAGFHRLQAKVTRVWQNNHRVTLVLDNALEVKIHHYDLPNFNAHMLKTLAQKNIEIRGWLHVKNPSQVTQNKPRFMMTVRHPDAIKMLH